VARIPCLWRLLRPLVKVCSRLAESIVGPIDRFSEVGWSLLGSNMNSTPARLKQLGWEPLETRKKSFYEYIPEEMELVLRYMQ
jgi:hypothetical protein